MSLIIFKNSKRDILKCILSKTGRLTLSNKACESLGITETCKYVKFATDDERPGRLFLLTGFSEEDGESTFRVYKGTKYKYVIAENFFYEHLGREHGRKHYELIAAAKNVFCFLEINSNMKVHLKRSVLINDIKR